MAKKRSAAPKPVAPKKPKQQTATFDDFKAFLHAHLCNCENDSGGGLSPNFPSYDLMPQDYLTYAAEALENPTDANRINCIAHLKRAAECQADTLFHLLCLSGNAKIRNFPMKMTAIASLDLMPSRSIAELNRIRNKMEHEYAVPKIDDLNLYFDLVAGFVSSLEGAIFMLVSNAELDFWGPSDASPRMRFKIAYKPNDTMLHCIMSDGAVESHLAVKPDDWDTFLQTFRILFLLIRCGYNMLSPETVLVEMEKAKTT